MAPQINTYGGLRASVLDWLARPADQLLDSRFDDFLMNCERRIYYGFAAPDPNSPMNSAPLRIAEMEFVNPGFGLSAVTPQPADFLEFIAAQMNVPPMPLQFVNQRMIEAYAGRNIGSPRLIAVAGTTFRVKEDPGGAPATLRYFRKLVTPSGSATNAILANYPDVYLNGCLIEAAIYIQDEPAAQRYAALYNASVAGLNRRTQNLASSVSPVIRTPAGPTP